MVRICWYFRGIPGLTASEIIQLAFPVTVVSLAGDVSCLREPTDPANVSQIWASGRASGTAPSLARGECSCEWLQRAADKLAGENPHRRPVPCRLPRCSLALLRQTLTRRPTHCSAPPAAPLRPDNRESTDPVFALQVTVSADLGVHSGCQEKIIYVTIKKVIGDRLRESGLPQEAERACVA
jgi:hypothetical protein